MKEAHIIIKTGTEEIPMRYHLIVPKEIEKQYIKVRNEKQDLD